MDILSLEDSLNLLSPGANKTDVKKRRGRKPKKPVSPTSNLSPIRVPSEIKKSSKNTKSKSKPKPKKIKKETPQKTTVVKSPTKNKKVSPVSPTKLPLSPIRESDEDKTLVFDSDNINISELLSKYNYKILRMIKNKVSNRVEYVIAYDSNGQIVFIDIEDYQLNYESSQIINIEETDDPIQAMDSYVNNYRENMIIEISGLIFFDGNTYSIMKRDDLGNILVSNYKLLNEQDKLSIPQIYTMLKLSEIELDPVLVLKYTNKSYKVIQDSQWNNNNAILSDVKDSIESLNISFSDFENEYLKYVNGIMTDWKSLSKHSIAYYKKFNKDELTEEDTVNFNSVSINMLSRFESFSRCIEIIEELSEIINDVCKSSIYTNEITEMLRARNLNIGKMLDENEIDVVV